RNRSSRSHWFPRMQVRCLHPETVMLLVEHANPGEPFYPRITRPAGRHNSQRESMLLRQRLAVHLISQNRIAVERFLHRNRSLEIRHSAERDIRSIKKNLLGRILNAGALEDIRQ